MESCVYKWIDTKKFLSPLNESKSNNYSLLPVDKSSFANNKGFTLVEVLVALTLLLIGVMAVVSMFVVSMSANQKAARYSVANNLGQAALEDILAKGIDDPLFVNNSTDVSYDLDPNSAATSITVTGAGTYTATYSITIGTSSNSICAGNVMVAVTIHGPGFSPMTLSGFKRII
ncbi:MAG: prepilin-type N-terminal cleavage/methylation domain-containing protein [Proteobacteria bacterium]|nr:prepilin-type N-terminal cleavage/methylation domain-containing protein [Pseudomonadota bacterium]